MAFRPPPSRRHNDFKHGPQSVNAEGRSDRHMHTDTSMCNNHIISNLVHITTIKIDIVEIEQLHVEVKM
jgi:hypothetical protein